MNRIMALVVMMLISCVDVAVAHAHSRRDIATFSGDRGGRPGVYILHPDGSALHKISDRTPSFINESTRVAWSPDRSKVAFEAGPEYGEDLYVWNKRTDRVRRITDRSGREVHPSWSPDSKHIVYVNERFDGSDLFVVSVDGSGERRLTSDDNEEDVAEWSPDGTRIVYQSFRGLFVIRPDGGGRLRLTRRTFDQNPSWAPGSRWLVFSRIRTGGRGAYLVRVKRDRSKRAVLTDSPDRDGEPEWSPDGSRIVFVRSDTADVVDPAIYSIRPSGRRLQRLTRSREGSGDFYPEWSPDGRRIAYRRFHEEADENEPENNVWVMRRNGSGKRNLTGGTGPGGFFGLDW